MKAALLVGMIAVSTTLCAQAPTPTASVAQSTTAVTAASHDKWPQPESQTSPGFAMQAELIRGLDARKAKPGDAVLAKCIQDINLKDDVLIPRNARLIGHVTEVQTRGHGKAESTLGITFDKAIMRDGRELPLTASIQALAPPAIMASEVGDTDLGVRNALPATPRTSRLFAVPHRTVPSGTSPIISSALIANSTGIVGAKDLRLHTGPSSAASVIHSNSRNVRLESGTRLILRVSFP